MFQCRVRLSSFLRLVSLSHTRPAARDCYLRPGDIFGCTVRRSNMGDQQALSGSGVNLGDSKVEGLLHHQSRRPKKLICLSPRPLST